jgi:hypothetical protein
MDDWRETAERSRVRLFQGIKQKLERVKKALESDIENRQREPVVAAVYRQLVAEMLEAAEMAETESRGIGGRLSDPADVCMSKPLVITELVCPVPGCTRSGILSLHSLCEDHYDELPEDFRQCLRAMRQRPRREA